MASKAMVSKLRYRAKMPFFITSNLWNNSFIVQSYDALNSDTRKYKKMELYLLHLALFPSQPLDIFYKGYLNNTHAPILNPFKRSMKIELHNKN